MVNAFLSLVVINQNEEESLLETVDDLFEQLNSITTQFELIIVDNCSSDSSVKILEEISLNDKYKNIQIYALSHSVDMQTAAFAGIENALGDFVCIYNQIPTDQKLMRDLFNNAVNLNGIFSILIFKSFIPCLVYLIGILIASWNVGI